MSPRPTIARAIALASVFAAMGCATQIGGVGDTYDPDPGGEAADEIGSSSERRSAISDLGPGEIHRFDVNQGGWVGAQLQRDDGGLSPLILFVEVEGQRVATSLSASQPYLTYSDGASVVVGVENTGNETLSSATLFVGPPSWAFCNDQETAWCEGDTLRFCATNQYSYEKEITYGNVDCTSYDGCDPSADRCRDSSELGWCDGNVGYTFSGLEQVFRQDCDLSGGSCLGGYCR